jgi:FdhE protein
VAQRLGSPEEIAVLARGEIPFLRLPDRQSVFSRRAARLRELAPGHAMAGYLEFIARVADAQQRALDALSASGRIVADTAVSHPDMRPLDVRLHRRDAVWSAVLRDMLRELSSSTVGQAQAVITALESESDAVLDVQADRLLNAITLDLNTAYAPLIGAALQVYWTQLASLRGPESFARTQEPNLCPCCGSRPLASVVGSGGREGGQRYLHCSLCAAEWHLVRIQCAACGSTKGISYQSLEGGQAVNRLAVRAECCDECGGYLKIMYREHDRGIEPVADDLATLALDLLVVESGKTPAGVNFMLVHGDAAPDSALH